MKFVGIGSVGRCAALPCSWPRTTTIFLQVKEATASMLELHADKSRHDNLGERVVVGLG